jgi:hypothetical protein
MRHTDVKVDSQQAAAAYPGRQWTKVLTRTHSTGACKAHSSGWQSAGHQHVSADQTPHFTLLSG